MREHIRRRIERAEWSIFVFCDSEQHPGRRVAVTNFDQFGELGSGWNERVASRARKTPSAGLDLLGDTPAEDGWALGDVDMSSRREKFDLRCRRCSKPVPVPAIPRKLYESLDRLRDAGLTEVPLAVLGASIGRSEP